MSLRVSERLDTVAFSGTHHVVSSQLSGHVASIGAPSLTWCVVLGMAMFGGIVVTPAVWSGNPARRRAAVEVLKLLVEALKQVVQLMRILRKR